MNERIFLKAIKELQRIGKHWPLPLPRSYPPKKWIIGTIIYQSRTYKAHLKSESHILFRHILLSSLSFFLSHLVDNLQTSTSIVLIITRIITWCIRYTIGDGLISERTMLLYDSVRIFSLIFFLSIMACLKGLVCCALGIFGLSFTVYVSYLFPGVWSYNLSQYYSAYSNY